MQWQQSPQYSGMPWGDYLNTDEGQQAQQAFADWGAWTQQNAQEPARPTTQSGAAPPPRPVTQYGQQSPFQPPPSQTPPPAPSNPYGFPQGQGVGSVDMTRYTPTSTTPTQTYQSPGTMSAPGGFALDMSNYGNAANNPNRPAATPLQMSFYGIGGQPMASMGDMMNQRAAVLAQLLDQAGLYSVAGATGQNIGPPQYDLPSILQNANSMVQSGWQNPFNFGFQDPLETIGQQAPPRAYVPTGTPANLRPWPGPTPSISFTPDASQEYRESAYERLRQEAWRKAGKPDPLAAIGPQAPPSMYPNVPIPSTADGDLAFLPGPGFQEPDWMRNMAAQGYVF